MPMNWIMRADRFPAPPPGPDFTITGAAGATFADIPVGLWTNGGLIAVESGLYSPADTVFLNRAPTNPLVFRGTSAPTEVVGAYWQRQPRAGTHARINNTTATSAKNIVFEDLEIVSNSWGGSLPTCFRFLNTNNGAIFRRCWFHAGYRGDLNVPLNAMAEYPEYAAIVPVFNSAGEVVSLDIVNPFVGDLVGPGTYAVTFTLESSTGIDFSVLPTGWSVVVTNVAGENRITSIVTGTPGASNGRPADGLGRRSSSARFAGQQPMVEMLPWAVRGSGGNRIGNEDMVYEDCLFTDVANAIKTGFSAMPADMTKKMTITRNTFDRVYMDMISVGVGTTAPGSAVPQFQLEVSWNYGTRPLAKSGDFGDPHADFIQLFMNFNREPWRQIEIFGNVIINGNTRGKIQLFLVADPDAASRATPRPNPFAYDNWYQDSYIVGNIGAGLQGNGFAIEAARYMYAAYNTVISWLPSDPEGFQPGSRLTWGEPGSMAWWGNVFHNLIFSNGAADVVNTQVVTNAIVPWTDTGINNTFVGQTTGLPTSLDEALAHYVTKGTAASKGAMASGYINFANRTINRALERPYVRLTPLGEQATNASVNTGWQKVIGGPATQTVSVTGGTYEVANDEAGGGAAPGTGTINRGQFIRVSATTAATANTVTTTTITLNGFAYNWTTLTASATVLERVDNLPDPLVPANRAWSRLPAWSSADTNDTQAAKFIFCWRTNDRQQIANNAPIIGGGTNAQMIGFTATGASTKRIINLRNTLSQTNSFRLRQSLPAVDGWKKHLVFIDLTQDTFANAVQWYINDELQTISDFDNVSYGADGFPDGGVVNMQTVFGSANGMGIFAFNGGGSPATLQAEFLWATWGNSGLVLPDHTDPVIRAQFDPDDFAANGDTAGLAAKLFVWGDAARWNGAGNTNRAGGVMAGLNAVKQTAGVDYTDVPP